MQEPGLLVSAILRHAARERGNVEIVSRTADGIHRTAYATIEARARILMGALLELGVMPGDKVATLAWNGFRHLELYYGIAGLGAVCHTVNPRLPIADIAHILNHAGDEIVCVDPDLRPILEQVLPLTPCVRVAIVLTDDTPPAAPPVQWIGYEAMMDAAVPRDWPDLDERSACGLCYTSGTTGRPRGVLYSHRSTVLHAMAINAADGFAVSSSDRVLPAVPMFHVNAWGLPYAAPMAGAALVLPGRHLDGASLAALMAAESVTFAAGVPTLWRGLLDHVRAGGAVPPAWRRVVIGGSACPRALIDEFAAHGVDVIHAWGMTETSPAITVNASADACRPREKVGRVLFGLELRAIGPTGVVVPRDGATQGRLFVRGHWVAERYLGDESSAAPDGFLPTGDVGTIDPDGRVDLTDRLHDLIKSGGEWISSIRLEALALSHPAVAEAAVIAARHDRWGERPLLIATARPGHTLDPADVLRVYATLQPAWWRPDAVLILESLPHGPTGKILKSVLRERHAGYFTDGL